MSATPEDDGRDAKLARLAREQGVRMAGVRIVDQMFVFNVPGEPDYIQIDAGRGDLFDALDAGIGALTRELLLPTAGKWVREGIQCRQREDFVVSYLYTRAALWIALHAADPVGIDAVSGNMFVVREGIRNVLERGLGPSRKDAAFAEPGAAKALAASLESVLPFIAGDAAAALERARVAFAALDAETNPRLALRLVHAIHRFAALAGNDVERDLWRGRLLDLSFRGAAWNDALEAAAEDLADVQFEDLIAGAGGSGAAIDHYEAMRPRLAAVAADSGCLSALANAFRHLAHLRLRATAAGGAFGHNLSFQMSPPLQHVGRDLVALQIRAGAAIAAHQTAEAVRTRALCDWMGRTHPHAIRMPREFMAAINPLTGSMNACAPATTEEIQDAAVSSGATILTYLTLQQGIAVWAVGPDGSVANGTIDDPSPLIEALVGKMPYLGAPSRAVLTPAGAAALDRELDALYQALIPAPVQKTIESGARLAILADGLLEAVPFAALRTPRGTYLVEEQEIVYWPSIAGWLQVNTAGAIVHRAAKRTPALVLSKTQFDEPVTIGAETNRRELRLPSLPGARDEARAVAAVLDGDLLEEDAATWEAMCRARRAIGVLHIATHGILDVADPERSVLVLADGPLTPRRLYQYDPGIRSELTVLSACQTALGAAHPDSVIGLANAFLVAGANAVVSSLWLLPDAPARLFMEAFYAALKRSNDETIPGALRAAQLTFLQHAQVDYRHPICWAAFKATGGSANPFGAK